MAAAGLGGHDELPQLLARLEVATIKHLVERVEAGEATAQEVATATALLGKAGSLARTGGRTGGGDDWLTMLEVMTEEEWRRFVAMMDERRAKASR